MQLEKVELDKFVIVASMLSSCTGFGALLEQSEWIFENVKKN